MSTSIDLTYLFHSTGEFEPPSQSGSEVHPIHRLFSRFLNSIRQMALQEGPLRACVVDFRMVFNPSQTPLQTRRQVQCLLIFSFKLHENADSLTVDRMRKELGDYCESLLTFTFRQYNFTIERQHCQDYCMEAASYIIEVLRPLDLTARQSKVAPEPFKKLLRVRTLANLLLRHRSSIGYSVTIDLHSFSDSERSLILQAGLQSSQDSLAKIGEHFALPLAIEEPTDEDTFVKPVCKLRLFSSREPSPFFISEVLECISPSFPRTIKHAKEVSPVGNCDRFAEESQELTDFAVTGDAPIHFARSMQSLMRKVYRSLGIDEIANIVPFPREPLPGVVHKKYTTFLPPISDLSPTGLLLGNVRTEASIDANHVRIPEKDRLRHLYVLGKTGTGKSSFLASSIIQDVINRTSTVVLDPHGDLCDEVVGAIPEAYLDHIKLIDPSLSTQYPGCSLNVLEVSGDIKDAGLLAEKKDYWTGELTSMFISLYGSEIFGPRIQEYFRAACLTLMDPTVQGTLVDVPRLFTDDPYRQQIRKRISDSYAIEFWNTYDQMGSREKQEMIPYFSAKFAPLVRSYMIRGFIGQVQSGLDLERYVQNGDTILIRLSKGRIGEIGARLIGMLLLAKIKAIVFARQNQELSERKPLMFYVDEFQNFVFEGFQTLLSEARKFGLGLVLAHQFLAQMRQGQFQLGAASRVGMLDAILGNIGSCAIFRIGAQDASELVTYVGDPVQARDLINLENYEFIGRVLNSGVLSAPMTIRAHRDMLLDNPVPRGELTARLDYLMQQFG